MYVTKNIVSKYIKLKMAELKGEIYNSRIRVQEFNNPGQAWWLMPIPALWEAKAGRLLEIRSSRPAWPTW